MATCYSLCICLSVCLSVYSESAHPALCLPFTASTQQVISLKVAGIDVKASLSNISLQKLRSLNLHVGLATRGLCLRCVFTAEVIPYQEHWKRTSEVESYNYASFVFLAYPSPRTYQEPYF